MSFDIDFAERVSEARKRSTRHIPSSNASIVDIEAELKVSGYLIGSKYQTFFPSSFAAGIEDTHSSAWAKIDSRDPDIPLLPDGYDIKATEKAWFPLRVQTGGNMLESTRKFVLRQGFALYWPRSVRVISRGNGKRKKAITLTRSAFGAYVLVHLPIFINGKKGSPFQLILTPEGRYYGIRDYVDFGGGPVMVPSCVLSNVIDNDRAGFYSNVIRSCVRGVKQAWPVWADIGSLVKIIDGPFASFLGVVNAFDAVRHRVEVLVSIFGRSTPITMELDQLEQA